MRHRLEMINVIGGLVLTAMFMLALRGAWQSRRWRHAAYAVAAAVAAAWIAVALACGQTVVATAELLTVLMVYVPLVVFNHRRANKART